MRPVFLVAALAAAFPAPAAAERVLTLKLDGTVVSREDRLLPPPDPSCTSECLAPRRARAAAAGPTVPRALRELLLAGAIDQERHDRWRAAYEDARHTARKLSGARRAALRGSLRNAEEIAARGLLTPSRGSQLFLTLARNRAWWAGAPLIAPGRRVTFEGSRLVFQHYAGEGLQIQWLGTFGKANAMFSTGQHDAELRELLDEALPLAAERAGGTAFEYGFRFGGGSPPWASGLAQGTAVQALARAAVRLAHPPYFDAARQGLAIFRTPPPEGVRVDDGAGAHFLLYSHSPALRVLNGFLQALNGLLDFARLANDEEGRLLFAAGEARLREELPLYDTGAWSRYSTRRESDLGYHRLTRDFLDGLCTRLLEVGAPDPAPYCAAAERFTAYLGTAPRLAVVSERLREAARTTIRFTVDKPATVTVTARRKGRVVLRRVMRVGSGRRSVAIRPAAAGPLRVALVGIDLAGNRGTAGKVVRVAPRR